MTGLCFNGYPRPNAHCHQEMPAARGKSRFLTNLGAGFASGCLVTCALNPWDRALFLSVAHRRTFWDFQNWCRPYQGVGQTLIQRTMSSGLYFPLEDKMSLVFKDNTIAGLAAGVVCGVVLSPSALLKYQLWGHPDENRSILRQAKSNWRHGGVAVFLRGMPASCVRDMVFGGVFATLRKLHTEAGEQSSFLGNAFAAAVATTFSSPFNFFRNIQFSVTPSSRSKTMRECYIQLAEEARQKKTLMGQLKFLQERLRIGWGTARVAVGMGLVARCYETLVHYSSDSYV